MDVLRFVFWISAFVIGYVYVGYPMLLALWARVAGRDELPEAHADADLPAVSIVVAARNEAARLPGRIENLLALDYPPERRQIIVVVDGSAAESLDALAPYRDRIEVAAIPSRGKAVALNTGVGLASHDVLVFADARQTFARDALRALVAPLRDPGIGGVSGALVLDCEDPSSASGPIVAAGVGLYWRYEKWLRRRESSVRSLLGATGAIYALRRSLWQPLPAGTLLDDVLVPMRAVLAGRRVVFQERAQAFDQAAPSARVEAHRKIRTLAGNVQLLWLEPRLLLPVVNPVWLQYVSHKVARLIVPYALLGLLGSSVALASQGLVYALALCGQCGFYLLAAYGAYLEWRASVHQDLGATKEVLNA